MSGGGKPHIMGVTLRRSSTKTPWGIRIVGGSDMGTPIIITRVQDGSPSSHELRRGDIIKKISVYDARDLRHEDAQNLFKSNENSISLVIQRDPSVGMKPSIKPAVVPIMPAKPPVAGGVPTPFAAAALPTSNSPKPFANSPAPPARLLGSPNPQNRCASPIVFPPPLPTSSEGYPFQQAQHGGKHHVQFRPVEASSFEAQDDEISTITNQPYRTTPLVLPGAKVKKDAASTSSYLRHHPNPMFRQAPSHYDPTVEVLMKQKVADTVLQRVAGEEAAGSSQVVHKQFNSPIGLYSDQNIAETIQAQTGITPNNTRVRTSTLNPRNQSKVSLKKTLSYDPAKSETFKALQEAELGDQVQEVTVPVQPRVFSPIAQAKRTSGPQVVQQHKVAAGPPVNHTNSIGQQEEIHQSGSFKRLMYQVLGESSY
ncbi:hypothetical protein L9F63_023445 [Diploptera punctata]|uniref:PDZ domain-containing protein n=1 Tax=Diploptera punctata TaxID=6984 RepID=A0AAD8E992_DIPPU|nr:hypothetical protein L9F63_023445 [Diploptera punctata]